MPEFKLLDALEVVGNKHGGKVDKFAVSFQALTASLILLYSH